MHNNTHCTCTTVYGLIFVITFDQEAKNKWFVICNWFDFQQIYTYKLRHFANKLQNAFARVTAYTFGILTRVR